MCPLEANTFGIEFKAFCIQDFETKRMLFEIGGLPEDGAGAGAATDAREGTEGTEGEGEGAADQALDLSAAVSAGLLDALDVEALRTIRYEFSVDVLRLPIISTTYVCMHAVCVICCCCCCCDGGVWRGHWLGCEPAPATGRVHVSSVSPLVGPCRRSPG